VKEKRDVATVNISGAFMQADMDELVHMRLEGTMAELLVKLDQKLYQKYITNGEWEKSTLRGIKKGAVWDHARRTAILEATNFQTGGNGI
jgi:hypothetical protein